jgi:flagellar hook assembly protein FlgD
VRFIVLKATDAVPKIEIFDLSGRVVTELSAEADGLARRFSWSGRDAAGQVVAPGLYLFRIDLGAQSGEDTALHSLSVAY